MHARLKNEFTEDKKYHNLMTRVICFFLSNLVLVRLFAFGKKKKKKKGGHLGAYILPKFLYYSSSLYFDRSNILDISKASLVEFSSPH